MDLLYLWYRRLKCFAKFIGTEGYFDDRIGPLTAWRIATAIHPSEDLIKWWLGTGWMGPGSHCYVYPCGDVVGFGYEFKGNGRQA